METEEEVWDGDSSDEDTSKRNVVDQAAATDESTKSKIQELIKKILLFLLSWQAAFTVSGNAVGFLLTFCGKFFSVLGIVTGSSMIVLLTSLFPTSLYLAYKFLSLNHDEFALYAVCGKSYSIYLRDNCLETNADGAITTKRCNYLQFPEHRQTYRRVLAMHP